MRRLIMKRFLVFVMTLALIPAALAAYSVNYEFWIINARGGLSYPIGEMQAYNDLGFNGGISGRKGLDTEISVGGGVTYMLLPYKTIEGSPEPSEPFGATIIAAEVVYAPYMPDFFVWPYLKGSVGMFLVNFLKQSAVEEVSSAQETSFGFMLGGGINYPLTNEIALNAEILYNQVSLSGGTSNNYTFFTFNGGITLFLK